MNIQQSFPYTIDLEELKAHCTNIVTPADLPLASGLEKHIAVYKAQTLLNKPQHALSELAWCLDKGPGVLVVKQAFTDTGVIDDYQAIVDEVIAKEKQQGRARGDHFAEGGANDRVWNALQKCCLRDPIAHLRYYANPVVALVAQAWLGPHYQVTSQINVVKPGGKAQMPHRDYHLGFQSDATCARFPAHVQRMSTYLTLQAAVAHTDMPIESGPTLLLPYSQRYEAGYLCWRDPQFIDYFDSNAVQLPLEKGDYLCFNPALLHAAGNNTTKSIKRCANLLQISSAFGQTMETIDRQAMSVASYPVLAELHKAGDLDAEGVDNAIAATADGYAFPTNLDRDQPIDGLAPQTMQQLMQESLKQRLPQSEFEHALTTLVERRQSQ